MISVPITDNQTCFYSATAPTKATKEIFYKLANNVQVMKQRNSRNLNFVVLR